MASVSIHAPRAGCDSKLLDKGAMLYMFQFTHPVRGATQSTDRGQGRQDVSIHAPRAGCDQTGFDPNAQVSSFNSRTPCGVRLPLLI